MSVNEILKLHEQAIDSWNRHDQENFLPTLIEMLLE
jgi:hypothetical protein